MSLLQDLGLGIVMLVILGAQSLSIFLELWYTTASKFLQTKKDSKAVQ